MSNSFYDLNVPWQPGDDVFRTLAFAQELGYSVVALNHTISGKLPADLVHGTLDHTYTSLCY